MTVSKMPLRAVLLTAAIGFLAAMTLEARADVTATLTASPSAFIGHCPVTIKFQGTITSDRRRYVTYRIVRSDGAASPVQTLNFTAPGTKNVGNTWTLGAYGSPIIGGWEAIEVYTPEHFTSARANFIIRRCI
jgi:hypothetical protein